jgi:hypothetical protein
VRRPGESVRALVDERATEKALSLMDSDRELTDEERAAKDEQRRVFWRSVGKRRRRAWK